MRYYAQASPPSSWRLAFFARSIDSAFHSTYASQRAGRPQPQIGMRVVNQSHGREGTPKQKSQERRNALLSTQMRKGIDWMDVFIP